MAPDAAASAAPVLPELTVLSTYKPRPVEWLWEPYLPAGMLALLSWEPGDGKTYVALAIAAALTTGRPPGVNSGAAVEPAEVLYLSHENNAECVLRPRFDGLGGDSKRFHLLQGVYASGGEAAHWTPVHLTDLAALTQAIRQSAARLVIVDPLQSFLGSGPQAKRGELRTLLDALSELAQAEECAILLIRHVSKARSGRAPARGCGGVDLTAAVRSEMLAGAAGDEYGLVHVKTNVGPTGRSLGYRIAADGVFSWTGPSDLTVQDMLSAGSTGGDPSYTLGLAENFLRELLDQFAKVEAEYAINEAKSAGIAPRTLYRAKARLGVISRRMPGEFGPIWIWWLPDPQNDKIPEVGLHP